MKKLLFLRLFLFLLLPVFSTGQVVINPYVFSAPTSGYDADAQRFIDSVNAVPSCVPLSTAQQDSVNSLVLAIKAAGAWDDFVAIYPFISNGSTEFFTPTRYDQHRFNLKDPATYKLDFNNMSTAHSRYGLAWDGANQWAETNIAPTDLPQDDVHISYYTPTNTTDPFGEMGAADDGDVNALHILASYNGTGFWRGNSTNYGSATNTNSTGFYINTRIASNEFNVYKDGTLHLNVAENSTGRSTRTIHIGRYNNGSPIYSLRVCGFASIGYGLDATKAAAVSTAVLNFQLVR